MSANETQVGGNHYKKHRIQHWDVAADQNMDYFQGQITKYVMRWKDKNGIEDLKKAQHILAKYIEVAEAGLITDHRMCIAVKVTGTHQPLAPGATCLFCGVVAPGTPQP